MARGTLYRTTIRDSWSWIWWDIPVRLLPLLALPLAFMWLTHTPVSALGITAGHVGRDLVLAIPFGLLAFAIAAGFSEYLFRQSRRWFVPDLPDLVLQSAYYVVLNAPIEEWFFRGLLQGTLVRSWHAPLLGYLATVLIFGAYHFLGRWGWRPVLGATVAGSALGLLYLWQPDPPSLLLPTLVHGAITCGFLSLGPFALFEWRRARGRLRPQVEAPRAVS